MAEQFSNAPAPSREEFEALAEHIGSFCEANGNVAKSSTVAVTLTPAKAYLLVCVGSAEARCGAFVLYVKSAGCTILELAKGSNIVVSERTSGVDIQCTHATYGCDYFAINISNFAGS